MSAMDKEKIFVELRKYHTDQFPDKLVNEDMQDLRKEFEVIEDNIVTMLLSLVNGKLGFVDFEAELNSFEKKVKIAKTGDRKEDSDRQFFLDKIAHLKELLTIAKASIFKLKIPRIPKVVKPA
jgi:hypothetical protein